MTRKIYRTAQGKMVDIGALQLQNENVRAVGNMPVNARGDLLDSMNRPIDTRNHQVTKQYNKQTSPSKKIPEKKAETKNQTARPAPSTKVIIPPTPEAEDFDDNVTKETISKNVVPTTPAPTSSEESGKVTGLAAAIAKARQVKQEPLKTPREAAQSADGVRKI